MADRVASEFGISLTDIVPVAGGADAAATVWRGIAADGREYAVKLSRRNTDAALLVARELASAGIPGIVAPLLNHAGRPSSCRDGIRLSLYDWISGPRGSDIDMTDEHWRLFGSLMGRVHRFPLAGCRPRRETFDNPPIDLARILRPVAFDSMSRQMVCAWDAAGSAIAELAVRSERLACEVRDRPASAAICHGDPHTINLIISDRPYLLDWDEVSIAPPERDLMFVIGGGIFTDNPITDAQQAAFIDGYGALDVDPMLLAYYYCTRALEDITEFAKEVLDRTADSASREFALRCFLGLLAPTGMVNVALSRTW